MKPAATVLVTGTLLLIATGVGADSGRSASLMESYRAAGQALLQDQIAPALARTAAASNAPRGVDVVVTASADPLDLGMDVDAAGARQVRVSAGFLMFLEALVEAEVTARFLKREDVLRAYVDDVVRYAGIATRAGSGKSNPGRFHRRLGLSKVDHDVLVASRAYQSSLSNNMVQSLAWIAAHRTILGPTDEPPNAAEADRRAARWVWASGFAPFPRPGAAMLYFAAVDPSATSAEVRCYAQAALLVSLEETRRAARMPESLPLEVTPERLQGWVEMVEEFASVESCERHAGRTR